MNYYNEFDPFAAEWLRMLIDMGELPEGDVDERSIEDVRPNDLKDYIQCHFFAGIGGWSLALKLAEWPEDRRVWTGSCPCQPFSAAGKRGGVDDERHLWPHWFHLIRECAPTSIFGEQVASKDGLGWLDLVQADLEGEGYAVGAADMCAAGVGSPHLRQRLWFTGQRVAYANNTGPQGRQERRDSPDKCTSGERGLALGLADTDCLEREGRVPRPSKGGGKTTKRATVEPTRFRGTDGLADTDGWIKNGGEQRLQPESVSYVLEGRERPQFRAAGPHRQPHPTDGFWRNADWLFCRDGKWRPVEPGTFPLAHGVPARMGQLRGYGNAIVPQVGATFIQAYMEA